MIIMIYKILKFLVMYYDWGDFNHFHIRGYCKELQKYFFAGFDKDLGRIILGYVI